MSQLNHGEYAFIALGANLPSAQGNPLDTLRAALTALQGLSASPLLVSNFYGSDPKDCPAGSPVYVNAVAALLPRAGETPESLLAAIQEIEYDFGRVRTGIINESRTLDLDLLAFRDESRVSADLTLPHPRAHERRFVLRPWLDIADHAYLLVGHPLQYWLTLCQDPSLTLLATPDSIARF